MDGTIRTAHHGSSTVAYINGHDGEPIVKPSVTLEQVGEPIKLSLTTGGGND